MRYERLEELEAQRFQNSRLYGLQTTQELSSVLGVPVERLRALSSHPERYYDSRNKLEPKQQKDGTVTTKTRAIQAPKRSLKEVQKQIKQELSLEQPPPYLSSPVKGRSPISNASAHQQRFEVAKLEPIR